MISVHTNIHIYDTTGKVCISFIGIVELAKPI